MEKEKTPPTPPRQNKQQQKNQNKNESLRSLNLMLYNTLPICPLKEKVREKEIKKKVK